MSYPEIRTSERVPAGSTIMLDRGPFTVPTRQKTFPWMEKHLALCGGEAGNCCLPLSVCVSPIQAYICAGESTEGLSRALETGAAVTFNAVFQDRNESAPSHCGYYLVNWSTSKF